MAGEIIVTGYPSGSFIALDAGPTLESSEILSKVVINTASFAATDTYIEMVYNGETVRIDIVEECRYTPRPIHFINKHGGQETIYFFKYSEESLKVSRESYENNRAQPNSGVHQFREFNTQGRSNFSANSGFYPEESNGAFKELILSTRVWTTDGVDIIPLNVSKTSLKYKTRAEDRLIDYTFDFEYSYNEVNNI